MAHLGDMVRPREHHQKNAPNIFSRGWIGTDLAYVKVARAATTELETPGN